MIKLFGIIATIGPVISFQGDGALGGSFRNTRGRGRQSAGGRGSRGPGRAGKDSVEPAEEFPDIEPAENTMAQYLSIPSIEVDKMLELDKFSGAVARARLADRSALSSSGLVARSSRNSGGGCVQQVGCAASSDECLFGVLYKCTSPSNGYYIDRGFAKIVGANALEIDFNRVGANVLAEHRNRCTAETCGATSEINARTAIFEQSGIVWGAGPDRLLDGNTASFNWASGSADVWWRIMVPAGKRLSSIAVSTPSNANLASHSTPIDIELGGYGSSITCAKNVYIFPGQTVNIPLSEECRSIVAYNDPAYFYFSTFLTIRKSGPWMFLSELRAFEDNTVLSNNLGPRIDLRDVSQSVITKHKELCKTDNCGTEAEIISRDLIVEQSGIFYGAGPTQALLDDPLRCFWATGQGVSWWRTMVPAGKRVAAISVTAVANDAGVWSSLFDVTLGGFSVDAICASQVVIGNGETKVIPLSEECQSILATNFDNEWFYFSTFLALKRNENNMLLCNIQLFEEAPPAPTPAPLDVTGGGGCAMADTTTADAKFTEAKTSFQTCETGFNNINGQIQTVKNQVSNIDNMIDTLSNSSYLVNKLIRKITRPLAPGIPPLVKILGRVPVYGTAIKLGLRAAEIIARAIARVMARLRRVSNKADNLMSTIESVFANINGKVSKVTSFVVFGADFVNNAKSCVQHSGNSAQCEVVEAAFTLLKNTGAFTLLDGLNTAGTACVSGLDAYNAALINLQQLLQPISDIANTVASLFSFVNQFLDFMQGMIEQVGGAIACAADCITGNPLVMVVSAGFNVASCPVTEGLQAALQAVLTPIENWLSGLINQVGNQVLEALTNALVPSDIDFEIPDPTPLLPTEITALITSVSCMGAIYGSEQVQNNIAQVSDILAQLPYRVTSDLIRQQLVDYGNSLLPQPSIPNDDGSACANAWGELTSLFDNYETCCPLYDVIPALLDINGFINRLEAKQRLAKIEIDTFKRHADTTFDGFEGYTPFMANILEPTYTELKQGTSSVDCSGADLCATVTTGLACHDASRTDLYLPASCDLDCAIRRCDIDPLCSAYERNSNGRFKLKTGVVTAGANFNFQCFTKPLGYTLKGDKACVGDFDGLLQASQQHTGVLCQDSNYLVACTEADPADFAMPTNCDIYCAVQSCDQEPLCTGFTKRPDGRFVLMGADSVKLSSAPSDGSQCYSKPGYFNLPGIAASPDNCFIQDLLSFGNAPDCSATGRPYYFARNENWIQTAEAWELVNAAEFLWYAAQDYNYQVETLKTRCQYWKDNNPYLTGIMGGVADWLTKTFTGYDGDQILREVLWVCEPEHLARYDQQYRDMMVDYQHIQNIRDERVLQQVCTANGIPVYTKRAAITHWSGVKGNELPLKSNSELVCTYCTSVQPHYPVGMRVSTIFDSTEGGDDHRYSGFITSRTGKDGCVVTYDDGSSWSGSCSSIRSESGSQTFNVGDRVSTLYDADGLRYYGYITAVFGNECTIAYDDGDVWTGSCLFVSRTSQDNTLFVSSC